MEYMTYEEYLVNVKKRNRDRSRPLSRHAAPPDAAGKVESPDPL